MPKKLDLTENLEKYIIDHSEDLTDVQKEIIKYNIFSINKMKMKGLLITNKKVCSF